MEEIRTARALTLAPISKRKDKKGRKRLLEKRQNKHATNLQKAWRGFSARSSLIRKQSPAETPPEPVEAGVHEPKFTQVKFDRIQDVQFSIERAVGLPVNCTATRVSMRVMTQSRKQVVEPQVAFSEPSYPQCSPPYNLVCRLHELHPTHTILCRIDTLSRADLTPTTVGYAALKVFVDENDMQPKEDFVDGQPAPCRLFSGHHSLPVVLGPIPKHYPLTQENIQALPHIPGASLEVKLVDVAHDTRHQNSQMHCNQTLSDTVAESLYATYSCRSTTRLVKEKGWPELPLYKTLGAELALGSQIEDEDWGELRLLLMSWMATVFPAIGDMKHTVDHDTMLCYDDDCGILTGVDMLYSMPIPKYTRPNTIIGYKVCLQYLRGKSTPFKGEEGCNPDYILDDVSTVWDVDHSTPRCAVYSDGLKRGSDMDLGPKACALILVTQVDITFASESSYDLRMPFRHPDRSWWGLLPLRRDSPFYTPKYSDLRTAETAEGMFTNRGSHHIPLLDGIPPHSILASADPFATLVAMLSNRDFSVSVNSCCCMWWCDCCVPTSSKKVHPDEFQDPVLSPTGASAIVRVEDGRMEQFVKPHIIVDGSISPDTKVMDTLLAAQQDTLCGTAAQKRLFAYNAMKYEGEPTIKNMLIDKLKSDTGLLTDAINVKAQTDIQEYVDSLPID